MYILFWIIFLVIFLLGLIIPVLFITKSTTEIYEKMSLWSIPVVIVFWITILIMTFLSRILPIWIIPVILCVMLFVARVRQKNAKKLKQEMIAKEIEQCEKAIADNPDNAASYIRLGEINENIGNLSKAIEFYRKADEIYHEEKLIWQIDWLEKRLTDATLKDKLVCGNCRQINPRRFYKCEKCGSNLYKNFFQWLYKSEFVKEHKTILFAGMFFVFSPFLILSTGAYFALCCIWTIDLFLLLPVNKK